MGRTAKTITNPADDGFNPARLEEAGAAAQQLGQLHRDYSEERDILNQLMGQSQMAEAMSKFTTVVSLQKLKNIKETQMYRALAGKKAFSPDGGEITDVGTWAGFCKMIGKSASKVDEDLENLNVFGEDALSRLSAVGAGYRELRQYRKLPEDERMALIEVAKTGDKESLVDLAETIMAKHAKDKETLIAEREALAKEAADAKAIAEDKDGRIKEVQEENEKLREERAKRTRYTPDQAAKEASGRRAERMQALNDAALAAMDAINEFGIVLADVSTDGDDRDQGMNTARWLAQQISNLYVNHQIDVDFAETITPTWTKAAKS